MPAANIHTINEFYEPMTPDPYEEISRDEAKPVGRFKRKLYEFKKAVRAHPFTFYLYVIGIFFAWCSSFLQAPKEPFDSWNVTPPRFGGKASNLLQFFLSPLAALHPKSFVGFLVLTLVCMFVYAPLEKVYGTKDFAMLYWLNFYLGNAVWLLITKEQGILGYDVTSSTAGALIYMILFAGLFKFGAFRSSPVSLEFVTVYIMTSLTLLMLECMYTKPHLILLRRLPIFAITSVIALSRIYANGTEEETPRKYHRILRVAYIAVVFTLVAYYIAASSIIRIEVIEVDLTR